MFDQTGLDQADPSDYVSSFIIEASIGPRELDDYSISYDSDNKVDNFPTLPNRAPGDVKSHDNVGVRVASLTGLASWQMIGLKLRLVFEVL